MPSVTLNLYDIHRKKQASGVGGYDLVTTLDVYCMIVISSYTVNQNTHDFRDDLGANEVSGTGYTTLGNICDNPTATLDGSGNFSMDFDDPATWSYNAAGFTNGDLPVGISFMGTAFSEPKILALGYAYEQASQARRLPVHTPALAGETIEVPDAK